MKSISREPASMVVLLFLPLTFIRRLGRRWLMEIQLHRELLSSHSTLHRVAGFPLYSRHLRTQGFYCRMNGVCGPTSPLGLDFGSETQMPFSNTSTRVRAW